MNDAAKIVMVDITDKPEIVRIAKAEGVITVKQDTLQAIREKRKTGEILDDAIRMYLDTLTKSIT